MEKHITAPITEETAKSFQAGDYVYVTGTIYTARDAAHKRMYESIGQKAKNYQLISKIRQFIIWDHLLQERDVHWICRTDNKQPYG